MQLGELSKELKLKQDLCMCVHAGKNMYEFAD